jgi:hypothetical protein
VIILPSAKHLETKSELAVPMGTVRGFFKMEAVRPDGSRRLLADWFPNLITDVGLNRIGTGSYLNACHIGTNNTAPTVGDTALAGFVAGSNTVQASAFGAQSTAPYYGWKTITYRFAASPSDRNLNEVGIATSPVNGGSTIMFSRALILDEFGAPSTVTVLTGEILDVTYQLRLYPMLVDVTQTVTITGSGSHDIITRASTVTSTLWGGELGAAATIYTGSTNTFQFWNGDIGPITGSPSGSQYGKNAGNLAYVNNSLQRDGTAGLGLSEGNLAGGIRALKWRTSLGVYQQQFDPVISKNNTKTLTVVVRYSWARNV